MVSEIDKFIDEAPIVLGTSSEIWFRKRLAKLIKSVARKTNHYGNWNDGFKRNFKKKFGVRP